MSIESDRQQLAEIIDALTDGGTTRARPLTHAEHDVLVALLHRMDHRRQRARRTALTRTRDLRSALLALHESGVAPLIAYRAIGTSRDQWRRWVRLARADRDTTSR